MGRLYIPPSNYEQMYFRYSLTTEGLKGKQEHTIFFKMWHIYKPTKPNGTNLQILVLPNAYNKEILKEVRP
jgi:hypothetical protein